MADDNTDNHEDPAHYYEGGFCPVELGNCVADRFTVLQKLGYGGFGTVWLARDNHERHGRRYIALKVFAAHWVQDHGPEVPAVIQRLRQSDLFVTELERCFHTSRNGRHLCQVFPILGPSLASLNNDDVRLYPAFVKDFTRQLARALDTMHALGVCHGDLTLTNAAVRLGRPLDDLTEDELGEIFGPPRIQSLDYFFLDQPPLAAPSYVVRPVSLGRLPASYLSTNLGILDLDEAFFTNDPPKGLAHVPSQYLAPEAIFSLTNGPAADVWALGCIIFGLRIPMTPFQGWMGSTPFSTAVNMSEVLGGMPQEWRSFLFEDGYPVLDPNVKPPIEPDLRYCRVGDVVSQRPYLLEDMISDILDPQPDGTRVKTGGERMSLCPRVRFRGNHRGDGRKDAMTRISKEDAELFTDLLRRIFTYDYRARLTPRQILEHPWLKEEAEREGTGGEREGSEQSGPQRRGLGVEGGG